MLRYLPCNFDSQSNKIAHRRSKINDGWHFSKNDSKQPANGGLKKWNAAVIESWASASYFLRKTLENGQKSVDNKKATKADLKNRKLQQYEVLHNKDANSTGI